MSHLPLLFATTKPWYSDGPKGRTALTGPRLAGLNRNHFSIPDFLPAGFCPVGNGKQHAMSVPLTCGGEPGPTYAHTRVFIGRIILSATIENTSI